AGESERAAGEKLGRAVLAVAFDQFRLVVEQVEVWRRASQVQVNHPLGPRRVMRLPLRQRPGRIDAWRAGRRGCGLARHGAKCNGAQSQPTRGKKMAPRDRL